MRVLFNAHCEIIFRIRSFMLILMISVLFLLYDIKTDDFSDPAVGQYGRKVQAS